MTRLLKFKTSSLKIGPLSDAILFRALLLAGILIISLFIFGMWGAVVTLLAPVLLLRIGDDFLDEYLFKKIKGGEEVILTTLSKEYDLYELFTMTFSFSEPQDKGILEQWITLLNNFKNDLLLIRFPYRFPVERYIVGRGEYDSLFNEEEFYVDAYFIAIKKNHSEDFEKSVGAAGLTYRKVSEEEEEYIGSSI